MNFTVVSLLSLLSFTSLVTSPAICMSSDSEDDSPTSSPRAPRAKSTKLPAELDLDSLVSSYDHLRTIGNASSDESLIAYIAAKSWGTMDLHQQEKVIAHVRKNSKTREAFALTSLVSKYDAVKPSNSTPDKELIAYLAGTSWPTDADEQVELVARVLAASTLAPKATTPVTTRAPAAATTADPSATATPHRSSSPTHSSGHTSSDDGSADSKDTSSGKKGKKPAATSRSRSGSGSPTPGSAAASRSRSPSPTPTSAAAAAADPSATATSTPTKVAKAPLDVDALDNIRQSFEVISQVSTKPTAVERNKAANTYGAHKNLPGFTDSIRVLLPTLIELDPAHAVADLEAAQVFLASKLVRGAFTKAKTGKDFIIPSNGINPSNFLVEVATLVKNIVRQNPGDKNADAVKQTFHAMMEAQGEQDPAALNGRLAFVYGVAFNYLVKKYNAK